MNLREAFFHQLSGNFLAVFIGLIPICLSTYINGSYGIYSGPAPVIIGLTIMCAWITRLHAYREAIRIAKRKRIDHELRFITRFIIAFFIGMIIHGFGTEFNDPNFVWVWPASILYIGSLFWLLFDFILNHDRDLAMFYVSNWYRTSWLDKLFHRDPRWWLISKIALYLLALYIYIEVW